MTTHTFGGRTYTNGKVPPEVLAELEPRGRHGNSGTRRAFLRKDAAASWNRAVADVKRRTSIDLRVRGWNRTYQEQVDFYLQRHRLARAGERACCSWRGRRYVFTGTAHAAPPGESNHGWGLAVDVVDFGAVGQWNNPRRVKAFPILAEHGWTDTEGRGRIQEPWHLVYDPTKDEHRGAKPDGQKADGQKTDNPEDDDMRQAIKFHTPGRKGINAEFWGLWLPAAGGYLRYGSEATLNSAAHQYAQLGYEVKTRAQAGWKTNTVTEPELLGAHLNKEG